MWEASLVKGESLLLAAHTWSMGARKRRGGVSLELSEGAQPSKAFVSEL